jgi:hypothetical protein
VILLLVAGAVWLARRRHRKDRVAEAPAIV